MYKYAPYFLNTICFVLRLIRFLGKIMFVSFLWRLCGYSLRLPALPAENTVTHVWNLQGISGKTMKYAWYWDFCWDSVLFVVFSSMFRHFWSFQQIQGIIEWSWSCFWIGSRRERGPYGPTLCSMPRWRWHIPSTARVWKTKVQYMGMQDFFLR